MKKILCTDTGKWTRIKDENNSLHHAIDILIVREFGGEYFATYHDVEYCDIKNGVRLDIFRAVGGMREHTNTTREFIIV